MKSWLIKRGGIIGIIIGVSGLMMGVISWTLAVTGIVSISVMLSFLWIAVISAVVCGVLTGSSMFLSQKSFSKKKES